MQLTQMEYLTFESGYWCVPCKLSTGKRVWFARHVFDTGVTKLGCVYRCAGCGGDDITVSD